MLNLYAQYWWQYCIVALVGYLFGSVNYSVIFSKAIKKRDIRTSGSGNAGTTNMFRTFGMWLGLLAFVCDFLKGLLPALVTYYVMLALNFSADAARLAMLIASTFAIVGHIFPLYFRFRGGKGFASFLGMMTMLNPIFVACGVLPFFILLILFDRMSLTALLTVAACAAYVWVVYYALHVELCIPVTVSLVLVFFAHRQNIGRLFAGTEKPLGLRKKLFGKKKKADSADSNSVSDVAENEQTAQQQPVDNSNVTDQSDGDNSTK